jgi:hypothetical protein
MSLSGDVFRYDPDRVIDDLKKTAVDLEPILGASTADHKSPAAQESHERCVMRQNADQPIKSWRDHRVRLAVKHRGIGRDHSNVHHALASFFAFSTASSIPPTM